MLKAKINNNKNIFNQLKEWYIVLLSLMFAPWFPPINGGLDLRVQFIFFYLVNLFLLPFLFYYVYFFNYCYIYIWENYCGHVRAKRGIVYNCHTLDDWTAALMPWTLQYTFSFSLILFFLLSFFARKNSFSHLHYCYAHQPNPSPIFIYP